MPTSLFRLLIAAGLAAGGSVARATSWRETRLADLERRRATVLSPGQREVAARIMRAALDHEGKHAAETFTLWIKAGRRDDDSVFIESIADLLWDGKSRVNLPLATPVREPATVRKPGQAGAVLILENHADDAEIDREHLDRVLAGILEDAHFAVVLFVDDKNTLARLNPVLSDRLHVVDLAAPAQPCEAKIASLE